VINAPLLVYQLVGGFVSGSEIYELLKFIFFQKILQKIKNFVKKTPI